MRTPLRCAMHGCRCSFTATTYLAAPWQQQQQLLRLLAAAAAQQQQPPMRQQVQSPVPHTVLVQLPSQHMSTRWEGLGRNLGQQYIV
jgi:hypothetical protein